MRFSISRGNFFYVDRVYHPEARDCATFTTGDEEADRLWDTMSPAAQEILLSFNGPDYLSHVILGHRLKYAVLILAAWRVMLELSKRLERTTNRLLDCGDRRGGLVTHSGTLGSRISALFAGRIVQPV